MVPTQKILDTAVEIGADAVGLSGLITPSLDEMVGVATEMQRRGFEIPLMIGGATTSRAHTAVKVDGKYDGPVVWVKDASRSVPTLAALLSDAQRPKLLADVKADYDSLRTRHAGKGDRKLLPYEQAKAARDADRLGRLRPADAQGAGRPRARRLRHRRAARLHRLAAVLQRLGDEGQVPRHPQQPVQRRGGPQALRRRAGDARPDHRGEVDHRPRRVRLLPGRRPGRRHARLRRRRPHRGRRDAAPPAPAGRAPRGRAQPVARPTSSRRRRPVLPTTSAGSP